MKNKNQKTQQTSLKQILISKFEQSDIERQNAKAKAFEIQSRETEERFLAFFGQKPDRAEGNRAFFEDVTVVRDCGINNNFAGWRVVQNCSVCGGEINSAVFDRHEEIGEQLSKKPKHYHCGDSAKVESTEDKLVNALRDFISENCNCD